MNVVTQDLQEKEMYPFLSCFEYVRDSGCYYLYPQICKDIIITSGIIGIHKSEAIMKMKKNINEISDIMENLIPAFRKINRDIISFYAGDLAESIVNAASEGKGVEIAIGYPKVLVFNVN